MNSAERPQLSSAVVVDKLKSQARELIGKKTAKPVVTPFGDLYQYSSDKDHKIGIFTKKKDVSEIRGFVFWNAYDGVELSMRFSRECPNDNVWSRMRMRTGPPMEFMSKAPVDLLMGMSAALRNLNNKQKVTIKKAA